MALHPRRREGTLAVCSPCSESPVTLTPGKRCLPWDVGWWVSFPGARAVRWVLSLKGAHGASSGRAYSEDCWGAELSLSSVAFPFGSHLDRFWGHGDPKGRLRGHARELFTERQGSTGDAPFTTCSERGLPAGSRAPGLCSHPAPLRLPWFAAGPASQQTLTAVACSLASAGRAPFPCGSGGWLCGHGQGVSKEHSSSLSKKCLPSAGSFGLESPSVC